MPQLTDSYFFKNWQNNYRSHSIRYHIIVITLFTMAVFWEVHKLDFLIGWDDQWFVTTQYAEDGLTKRNLYAIFTDYFRGQYAPINQLYYTIMFVIFDYDPFFFHIGNVVIHIINCLLVYIAIKKISDQLFKDNAQVNSSISLVTSLLFAVSPINLEPVAWVSASKVLIYATFYILALITYIEYIIKKGSLYYYLTMLILICSFGAKEQAVVFPMLMLLLDYIYGRDLKNSFIWLEKLPMIVLCILFGLVTLQSQGVALLAGSNFYPVSDRLILAFYTTFEYFVKIILPINVSYLYPFPYKAGGHMPLWLWMYPIFISLSAYLLLDYLKQKWIFFSVMFFLIHIILVSNLFSLSRHSFLADRYSYIASIAIYFILAKIFITCNKFKKQIPYFLLVYIGYFSLYTASHLHVWKNAITLKENFRNIIEKRPDYKMWNNSSKVNVK